MDRDPLAAFRTNVRALMDLHDLSQTQLGLRSRVSQRNISNLMNPERDLNAGIGTAARVALAFRLPLWLLMLAPLPHAVLANPERLISMVETYMRLDAAGRAQIERVFANEARFLLGRDRP